MNWCKTISYCVFILSSQLSHSQNLIGNGSFEDTIGCPSGLSQIALCKGWYAVKGSCDFYHSCSINQYGVPYNVLGFQNASSGNAYAGIISTTEMIGIKLDSTLKPGNRYYIRFNISLADISVRGSNKIGVGMSTIFVKYQPLRDISNLPVFVSNRVVTDYENWTTIAGSFIADSSYKYFHLGSYFDENSVDYDTSYSPDGVIYDPYYLIDDVCLSADSTCFAQPTSIKKADANRHSIVFSPNPIADFVSISNLNNEPFKLQLFDALGRESAYFEINKKKVFDFSTFKPGIYYYRATFEDNSTYFGKTIKL